MTHRLVKILLGFLSLCAILITMHCGTVASVRPIGKGESPIALSSGGPVAPKENLWVEGAVHDDIPEVLGAEYHSRIIEFINTYVGN